MIRTLSFVFLGVFLLACGDDERAPSVLPPGSGGADAGGDSGPDGTGGSSPEAGGDGGASAGGSKGTGGGAATGGVPGDAGEPEAGDGGVPDARCEEPFVVAPSDTAGALCAPGLGFGAGEVLAGASTDDDDEFVAVTADELTVAWIALSNGVPSLYYADRDTATEAFNPYGKLTGGYFAAERPAVSPDGNRIVVVRADRKAFGEFTRIGRYYTFTESASEASFSNLNTQGATFLSDEYFGDPVLSNDDLRLYYSKYGPTNVETVHESVRLQPVSWPIGTPLAGAPLRNDCGARKHPTGISSDLRTLFYWDEASGTERATWRSSPEADFAGIVDLGGHPGAQPNAGCTRLYYSDEPTGDTFTADAR